MLAAHPIHAQPRYSGSSNAGGATMPSTRSLVVAGAAGVACLTAGLLAAATALRPRDPASITSDPDRQRAVDELTTAASRWHASDASTAPTQTTSSTAVQEISRTMNADLNWVDDGRCVTRALYGAALLEAHGADASRASRIAYLSGPFADVPGWPFHAALALDDATRGVVILDALVSQDPLPVDEWAARYGKTTADITWTDPLEAQEYHRSDDNHSTRVEPTGVALASSFISSYVR